MAHLVFTYGTLKQGFHNHYLLEESEFIGSGKTVELYAMYKHGVPFVVKEEAVSQIHGEVFSVDNETLTNLDQLEGHPDWYCREEIEVALDDGSKLLAWLYFNNTPQGKLTPSGLYEC